MPVNEKYKWEKAYCILASEAGASCSHNKTEGQGAVSTKNTDGENHLIQSHQIQKKNRKGETV